MCNLKIFQEMNLIFVFSSAIINRFVIKVRFAVDNSYIFYLHALFKFYKLYFMYIIFVC